MTSQYIITGLSWIPSWAHVMTSRSSSRVPYPPARNRNVITSQPQLKTLVYLVSTSITLCTNVVMDVVVSGEGYNWLYFINKWFLGNQFFIGGIPRKRVNENTVFACLHSLCHKFSVPAVVWFFEKDQALSDTGANCNCDYLMKVPFHFLLFFISIKWSKFFSITPLFKQK
jgi:hypothetical protein